MLDNITSFNVEDNYLMLDEYKQNISKEQDEPVGPHKHFGNWSFVRQQSSQTNEVSYEQTSTIFSVFCYALKRPKLTDKCKTVLICLDIEQIIRYV